MALYRRYRPQTFQDVIGQEHVTRPLMAALRADRTAHAYLFSGPRGCGKTTSARILARCLNCAQAPTDTPCGECESCRELSLGGGGSLDVIEMDAASHGGVDDARELIERAAFSPTRDRYKIFIIDEAHMVSNQGFNALLKLVEEPPPHIKFIFATTEPEKVIGTIRSRTHHYPFRLVPPDLLEDYMGQLCQQEGIQIGGGVLPLVVRAGGGSVRDSLSVLDQLMGGAEGGVLDYEQAIALLGYTDGSLLDDTVEAIAARDGVTLFSVVERVVHSGHDPRRFLEDLLERLRDIIVISLAGERARDVLAGVPEAQYERMLVQAEHVGQARASRCADLTNEALLSMKGATSPRLHLELLCARLLLPESAQPASSGGSAGGRPASAPGARPAAAQRQRPELEAAPSNPVQPGRKISMAWAAAEDGDPGSTAAPAVSQVSAPQPSAPAQNQGTTPEGRVSPNTSGAPARGVSPAEQQVPSAQQQGAKAGVPQAAKPAEPQVGPATPAQGSAQQANPAQAQSASNNPAHSGVDVAIIRQRWTEVLDAVHSKSTAALVAERNCQILGVRENVLGIQFNSAGLAATFNDRGHAPAISSAIHDVLGYELRVQGLFGGEPGPKAVAAPERRESRPAEAARGSARPTPPAQAHEASVAPEVPGDLEARGLVLAAEPADIPAGPKPSRDELASRLRALEAAQASRESSQEAASPVGESASPVGIPSPTVGTPAAPGSVPAAPATAPATASAAPAKDSTPPTEPAVSRTEPAAPSVENSGGRPQEETCEEPVRFVVPSRPAQSSPVPRGERKAAAKRPVLRVNGGDPAGVLGALVDGTIADLGSASGAAAHVPAAAVPAEGSAQSRPEPIEPSFIPDEPPFEPVELSAYPEDFYPPEDSSFAVPDAPLSEPQDEPFYKQRMPMPGRPPERAEVPSGQASVTSERSATSGQPFVSPERVPAPPVFSVPQRKPEVTGAASVSSAPRTSISERIMAAHGDSSRPYTPSVTPVSPGRGNSVPSNVAEEDEVSVDDPMISQSNLVGLEVVLNTFDATVIEEIPRGGM